MVREETDSLSTSQPLRLVRRQGQCRDVVQHGLDRQNMLGQSGYIALPSDIAGLTEHVLPIETVLDDIPALALTADEAQRLRCGQTVGLFTHHHRDWLAELIAEGRDGGIALALWQGKAVAMVRIGGAEAQPVRVFNYEP